MFSAATAIADTITLTDGSTLNGTVKAITTTDLEYTAPNSAVVRSVKLSRVFSVRYDNGEVETFTTAATAPVSTSAAAAPQQEEIVLCTGVKPTFTTDYSHLPPASREYRLFDYFNENGVEGIVIEVTDDGRHGKVLGLKEIACQYTTDNIIEPFSTGGRSLTDGEKNLNTLNQVLASNPTVSIDDFPAHKWVTSLGPGWYIPSFGEMLKIAWLFETKDSDGNNMKKHLNKALKSNAGDTFRWTAVLFGTSSEAKDYSGYEQNENCIYPSLTHKNGLYTIDIYRTKDLVKDKKMKNGSSRYGKYSFRAFHKF